VIGLRLAVLIAAVIVSGCGGPSQTGSPIASPPNGSGLLEWYQVEARERPDQDDVLGSLTLRTGFVDGTTTAEIALPFDLEQRWPSIGLGFVAGPAAGIVAYSLDDGRNSQVELVEVATGAVHTAFDLPQPIVAGTIHPSGEALYLVLGDRRSRRGNLVRVDLDGVAVAGEHVEVPGLGEAELNFLEPFELLHWTPDGSRLVVQRCGDACSYTVISHPGGGGRIHEPDATGSIVGISNTTLLAQASTWTSQTKRFFTVDLASGDVAEVEPEAERATLVEGPTGPLVVLQGAATLTVVDPLTDARRELDVGPDRFYLVQLVSEPERQGLPLPPGWIVLGDEGRISIDGPTDNPPVMVEVATGRIVELRNLGPGP
jgi:hypothetical protein